MIFYTLAQAVGVAVQIVVFMIIIRAVLSFFPQIERGHPLVRVLDQVVDPILRPFQRLIPSMGGLDFSPILAILTLQFVAGIVSQLLMSLAR